MLTDARGWKVVQTLSSLIPQSSSLSHSSAPVILSQVIFWLVAWYIRGSQGLALPCDAKAVANICPGRMLQLFLDVLKKYGELAETCAESWYGLRGGEVGVTSEAARTRQG